MKAYGEESTMEFSKPHHYLRPLKQGHFLAKSEAN